MAMACFGLVTSLPLRPLRSFPSFIASISLSTIFPAAGEYFLGDFFFAAVGMAILPHASQMICGYALVASLHSLHPWDTESGRGELCEQAGSGGLVDKGCAQSLAIAGE